MLRGILGVVAGLVASVVVVMVLQQVAQSMYPMPAGLDLKDREAVGAWMSGLPVGAFLLLLAGYALGSFAGGASASLVGKRLWPALAVGGLLTLMGIANLMAFPHPAWFAVASLALYLPLAWAGSKLLSRRPQA